MNWSRPDDLKAQLQKVWDKGQILTELLREETIFPLRLKLKEPASGQIAENFDQIRVWIAQLRALTHCRVVMREFNHRLLGNNSLPDEIWVDTVDDALLWLNRKKDFLKFKKIVELVAAREQTLIPWLCRNPFKALENADKWEDLLRVVEWMKLHPNPCIYVREVRILGLHTKFIERNQALLSQLIDVALNDAASSGNAQSFAARYGFREERPAVRFRISSDCSYFPGGGDQDISLDWETFANLNPPVRRVYITENKTNFLAFPDIPESMVIFGSGYGFEHLGAASWMLHCRAYYWGDIDTHGFGALHGARKYFPHIQSLMMDEETVLRFRPFKVDERDVHDAEWLENLNSAEQLVYRRLKDGEWGAGFRLEQEHIDWGYAKTAINATLVSEGEDESDDSSMAKVGSQDIRNYLNPSQCDLRVFLAERVQPTDEPGPYEDALKRLYESHWDAHRQLHTGCLDLGMLEEAERTVATIDAIKSRVPVISKPLLAVRSHLGGRSVEIFGEADFLILHGDRYIARNISLARRITPASTSRASVASLQLFGWLMKRALQLPPAELEILTGNNQIVALPRADADILRLLFQILAAKSSTLPPFSPVGLSKCSGCRFRTRCWTAAEERSDIALLPGVDQELARVLMRQGVSSVQNLLSSYDPDRLANLSRIVASRSVRVGNRAVRIFASARAFGSSSPLWMDQIEAKDSSLPQSPNWIILDLEGMPPHLDSPEIVFLYGMQVFGAQPGPYLSSIGSLDTVTDAAAWQGFLAHAQAIFNEYGDLPIVHWHHYEPAMLKKYINRHGDIDGIGARVLNNLIDLLPIVQDSVALPTSTYSLKAVEKFAGFTRSQTEFGGDWAMSQFLQATKFGAQEGDDRIIANIKRYNEEDLQATFAVLTWLQQNCAALGLSVRRES